MKIVLQWHVTSLCSKNCLLFVVAVSATPPVCHYEAVLLHNSLSLAEFPQNDRTEKLPMESDGGRWRIVAPSEGHWRSQWPLTAKVQRLLRQRTSAINGWIIHVNRQLFVQVWRRTSNSGGKTKKTTSSTTRQHIQHVRIKNLWT